MHLITNSDCNEDYQCSPVDVFDQNYVRANLGTGMRFDCRTASANLEKAGYEILAIGIQNVDDDPSARVEYLQILELEVYGN